MVLRGCHGDLNHANFTFMVTSLVSRHPTKPPSLVDTDARLGGTFSYINYFTQNTCSEVMSHGNNTFLGQFWLTVRSVCSNAAALPMYRLYLPQLNAMHCTSSLLPCSTAMQTSVQRWKENTATQMHYERRTFIPTRTRMT